MSASKNEDLFNIACGVIIVVLGIVVVVESYLLFDMIMTMLKEGFSPYLSY